MITNKLTPEVLATILNHFYPDLGDFSNIEMKGDTEGRLAFSVFVTDAEGKRLFVKISGNNIGDNVPLSTYITEEARLHGIPCAETFRGKSGELYYTIPDEIDGTAMPEILQGLVIKVMAFRQNEHEIPKDTPDPDHQIDKEIGRLVASLQVRLSHLQVPAGVDTEDPLSLQKVEASLRRTFSLPESPDEDALLNAEDEAATKLRASQKDSGLAHQFANGLTNGYLKRAFNVLAEVRDNLARHGVLPQGWPNNDMKRNNVFLVQEGDRVRTHTSFDYHLAGRGAVVKDLGRTIALSCVDDKTGEFHPDRAMAVIEGFLERRRLSPSEKKALYDYIRLGFITSFALRSSYFEDTLLNKNSGVEISKLNPSAHLQQLASFEKWVRSKIKLKDEYPEGALSQLVSNIQTDPKHQEVIDMVDSFMKSPLYDTLRQTENGLRLYFATAEAVHDRVDGTETKFPDLSKWHELDDKPYQKRQVEEAFASLREICKELCRV